MEITHCSNSYALEALVVPSNYHLTQEASVHTQHSAY